MKATRDGTTGEEAMVDAPEELAPKEEAMGVGEEGAIPEVAHEVKEAPAT